MPAGPEELTLQVLSPEQRGYRVFIHGQAGQEGRQDRQDMYKNMDIMFLYMIKQVCRGWAIAKSWTRVSEISSSS